MCSAVCPGGSSSYLQKKLKTGLHVCNGLASPANAACRMYTVKFVKLFATWQHWLDVDSNFLSYSAPLSLVRFRRKFHQFIC